jgi:hypothetical protein
VIGWRLETKTHFDWLRVGTCDSTLDDIHFLSFREITFSFVNLPEPSDWDVDDDGSLHKTMLHPDSAASRDRRKRKAENRKEMMTDHKRR